ncbi:hypothetical protein NG798_15925 [Ancylothrix sp. C2]|nr:hypothetical protein [Ancylothrix sp. D3o]
MKKTLLIFTGLMALSLPVHAAQVTEVNQAGQVEMNQQVKPIQTETAMCIRTPRGVLCRPR